MNSGEEIPLERVRTGDIVFLSGTGDNDEESITCVGVSIDGSSYIYAGRKTGYVAIGELYRENPDGIAVTARRIFN